MVDSHSCTAGIEFIQTYVTFNVTIGCPNSDSFSALNIVPKGGLLPYEIKINEHEYQVLNEISLPAGEYTLTIRDAGGTESLPQTITLASPINITLSKEPECSADSQTYSAIFMISGGTPPYSVNDVPIEGDSYTTDAIPSGTTATITVSDQQPCTAETTISHTCPLPCDLPSKGLSRRCAYRLWLQPSTAWMSYIKYENMGGIKFRFNGKDFDISEPLQINVDELNKDFRTSLAITIETLNKIVNESINNAFGVLSKNRLSISYTPNDTDPFEVLWVEHFIEDTFTFEFSFAYSTEDFTFVLNALYSNEQIINEATFNGMVLTNLESKAETHVPAFACSDRNQCTDSDFVPLCDGFDLKPDFTRERGEGNNLFIFTITKEMPTTGIIAWVWDFTTSTTEPFYVGEQVFVNWQVGGFVKLTAISEKGCFSSTVENNT